jgi:hypothetical protein
MWTVNALDALKGWVQSNSSWLSWLSPALNAYNQLRGMGVSAPAADTTSVRRGGGGTIPAAADGAIVPATDGGRLVRVAEGGEAEAIAPLSDLYAMIVRAVTAVSGRSTSRTVNVTVNNPIPQPAGTSVETSMAKVAYLGLEPA